MMESPLTSFLLPACLQDYGLAPSTSLSPSATIQGNTKEYNQIKLKFYNHFMFNTFILLKPKLHLLVFFFLYLPEVHH